MIHGHHVSPSLVPLAALDGGWVPEASLLGGALVAATLTDGRVVRSGTVAGSLVADETSVVPTCAGAGNRTTAGERDPAPSFVAGARLTSRIASGAGETTDADFATEPPTVMAKIVTVAISTAGRGVRMSPSCCITR